MLNNFGRNAFRMYSMHSECIQCIQNVFNAFRMYVQNQDPRSKILTRLVAKILDWYSDKDVLANPKSKMFHKTSVQILDLGSWFWEGMHFLAFSGSDKIALSTFVSVTSLIFNMSSCKTIQETEKLKNWKLKNWKTESWGEILGLQFQKKTCCQFFCSWPKISPQDSVFQFV